MVYHIRHAGEFLNASVFKTGIILYIAKNRAENRAVFISFKPVQFVNIPVNFREALIKKQKFLKL
jgi:hypothetical protein